eukprot:m.21890 g.21890  ORF g.21890 m.21890 type:complete len:367 (-) comp3681_c0_seq2:3210-4310(-)
MAVGGHGGRQRSERGRLSRRARRHYLRPGSAGMPVSHSACARSGRGASLAEGVRAVREEDLALQGVRQEGLRRGGVVGRVDIARAVAKVLHESGRGVADVEWYGVCRALADRFPDVLDGLVDSHRLGGQGQIRNTLRKADIALRHAQLQDRLCGGDGLRQGVRVGHADVLRGKANESTRNISWVLAALEHPAQPVQGSIRVVAAHALVQCADRVVVLVARLIVDEVSLLKRLNRPQRNGAQPALVDLCRLGSHFERVECSAGIAVRGCCYQGNRLVVGLQRHVPQPRITIGQRIAQDCLDRRGGQLSEHKDAAAREQGGIQVERRVLCRGTDQGDKARLDQRQECVLLRLVEMVDLVDEENGLAPV